MSKQYPGGIITKTPVVPSGPYETSTASGIWTLDQQAYWRKLNQWPIAGSPAPDAQFNYVTMLLHGDGTNGAQNNTFLDSSTNNFTITRNGNTTQGSFSPYGSNWSNFFDGSSYFTTTSSQIVPTGSFTVECLVFLTSTASQAFVAQGTSGNAARFSLALDGGLWWAQIGSAIVNLGTATIGTWTYLAATFNGTTLTLYVNGTSVGSASTTTSAQNTTLSIGNYGAAWTTSYYVNGYISNVRISNTVRTITTPTAPYTSDANTNALFCQSNRFIDASANAYAISITAGTPSVQRFNPFGTATAYSTSVIGGSGYFDGSGDLLTLADSSAWAFGSGDFTVELWYYPNSKTTTDIELIGQWTSGSTDEAWQIGHHWTFGLIFFWTTDGTTDQYIGGTSTALFQFNAWNHVVVSKSGTTVSLYLNGARTNTGTLTGSISDSSRVLDIGGRSQSGANQIQGYLSDVRVVKGTAVYNPTSTTLTVPTAPLTAITNTQLLTSFTNGAIFDNAMMNDLETAGNAQISTSVVKYGTGSLYFDGTGDALSTPNTIINSLGSGAFTIEMWVYRLGNGSGGISAYDALLGSYSAPGTSVYGIYITRSTGVINFFNSAGLVSSSNSLSNSSWTHIAVCRTSANNLQIFINGTSGYSATNTGTGTITNPFYIASDGTGSGGNSNFYGYIDDLRITKGYARYTANFTPPTAAFPNFGPN